MSDDRPKSAEYLQIKNGRPLEEGEYSAYLNRFYQDQASRAETEKIRRGKQPTYAERLASTTYERTGYHLKHGKGRGR